MAAGCLASAISPRSQPPTVPPTAAHATATAMQQAHYRMRRKLGDALYGAVWLCEDLRAALSSHAPPSPPPQQQRRLGDYQLPSTKDASNKNAVALVAIKQVSLRRARQTLLHNNCMDNPWDERRMAARIMRLGSHTNILQFRHEFLVGGSWFMVTEYCDGGDLLSRLQRTPDTRFSEPQALALFAQVARGVRFLHAHGIAHRDLSLENVLLRDGVCKISDFGLSTDAARVCAERVGKAYYMAPEVVTGREYDPAAADMWSLGVMLFIMLTGSPLAPSASVHEPGYQALRAFGVSKILAKWGLASDISSDTLDLLAGLLQLDPAKRLTAEALVQHAALQRCLITKHQDAGLQ